MVFVGLSGVFVYAMLIAAVCLALFTVMRYAKYVRFKDGRHGYPFLIGLGVVGGLILYLVFFCGYYLTVLLGLADMSPWSTRCYIPRARSL